MVEDEKDADDGKQMEDCYFIREDNHKNKI